jgi:hypothetical protein
MQFFQRLFGEYPGIKEQLVFVRRRQRFHPEVDCYSDWDDDVTAILDRSPDGIGLQIDPHLGYIVIWNEKGACGEFGDWGTGNDQVADAMHRVREILGDQGLAMH